MLTWLDCFHPKAYFVLLVIILDMVVIGTQSTIHEPLGIERTIPKQESRIRHISNILDLHPGKIHGAVRLTRIEPHHIMPCSLRMLS